MFTNKTEHFDLPQYVASDKPTYLVDFNNAMQKIDSTMYGATQDAEQASTTATSANNKVDEMRATVANLEQTMTTQGNSITALQNSNSLLTQRITQEEVKGQQRDVKIQSLESSVASATTDAENALTESGTLKGQLSANQIPFIYDYQNGQYGYNTDPARGADTFHPFKSTESSKIASCFCWYYEGNSESSYEPNAINPPINNARALNVTVTKITGPNTKLTIKNVSDKTLRVVALDNNGNILVNEDFDADKSKTITGSSGTGYAY